MGYGDAIMATAFARGGRAGFTHHGSPYWNEVFLHHPHIAQPGETPTHTLEMMETGEGYRAGGTAERIFFREGWRAPRGEIFLTEEELDRNKVGGIIIEPHTKGTVSGLNKQWDKWQDLVDFLPHDFVQLQPPWLDGVRRHHCRTFRDACAALVNAGRAVLPEGGLHHAAGAMHVPAVVIYGCFITPEIMGYRGQIPVWRDDPRGLGARTDNPHCRAAMKSITVEEVATCLSQLPA